MKSLTFVEGVELPVLGQGTWRMGEDPDVRRQEVACLREGLDLGLRLIDTAEMYGEGGAEEVVGEAIQGRRDDAYVVSKVYPHNASRQGVVEACERSLQRLRIDCLDLYLLHWRGRYPLAETVEGFERLRVAGKIRRWGVSNCDVADLEELDDERCATDQVLYSLDYRGAEFDLLPYCQRKGLPVMAYSPLGQGGRMLRVPALRQVAERHGVPPAVIALAWVLREPGVMAIPKTADAAHLRMNVQALAVTLTAEDLAVLDQGFAAPTRKQSLAML